MLYDIAEIIKGKIAAQGLPYIETLAGLVQVETVYKKKDNKNLIEKRYPIYCPITDPCPPGKTIPLVPDLKKKSIFYFQNNGNVTFNSRDRGYTNFTADLWLVGWLNPKALGSPDCSITAPIIAQLLNILDLPAFNDVGGVYTKIKIRPNRLLTKEPVIFAKYKYTKFHSLLEYPYDYFAVQLFVDFSIHENCINDFIVNNPIDC